MCSCKASPIDSHTFAWVRRMITIINSPELVQCKIASLPEELGMRPHSQKSLEWGLTPRRAWNEAKLKEFSSSSILRNGTYMYMNVLYTLVMINNNDCYIRSLNERLCNKRRCFQEVSTNHFNKATPFEQGQPFDCILCTCPISQSPQRSWWGLGYWPKCVSCTVVTLYNI